jgi:hypothetical protein
MTERSNIVFERNVQASHSQKQAMWNDIQMWNDELWKETADVDDVDDDEIVIL